MIISKYKTFKRLLLTSQKELKRLLKLSNVSSIKDFFSAKYDIENKFNKPEDVSKILNQIKSVRKLMRLTFKSE